MTFQAHPDESSAANSVALQPDGKAVVGGITSPQDGARRMFLARLGTDGTLDPTFGDGGRVVDPGPGPADFIPLLGAFDVAMGPDGRIAAALPLSGVRGSRWDWNVAVFGPDGSRDTSFDGDGWVTTPFQPGCDAAAASVAFDAVGRLVVAGIGGCFDRFIVARYQRNGALDPSFGEGGLVDLGVGGALTVTFDHDGRLLAGGGFGGPLIFDTVVARLDPDDGSLDPSFGDGGVVSNDFGGEDLVYRIAPDPRDGGLVVASGDEFGGIRLTRHTAGGSLDPSFSVDGTMMVEPFASFGPPKALGLQPDGRILVLGYLSSGEGGSDFGLLRLLPSGTVDVSWGRDGLVVTDFGGGFDFPIDLAVRPDGGVLAVGASHGSGEDGTAIAAYRGGLVESLCPGVPVAAADVVIGTSGDDSLAGSDRSELILGLGGSDTITGGGGDDCIAGGPGADGLSGGKGRDRLYGDAGGDQLAGGPDDDILTGAGDADAVGGGPGDDVVLIAAGHGSTAARELIAGGPSTAGDRIELGPGIGFEQVRGSPPRFSVTDPMTTGTFAVNAVEQVTDT